MSDHLFTLSTSSVSFDTVDNICENNWFGKLIRANFWFIHYTDVLEIRACSVITGIIKDRKFKPNPQSIPVALWIKINILVWYGPWLPLQSQPMLSTPLSLLFTHRGFLILQQAIPLLFPSFEDFTYALPPEALSPPNPHFMLIHFILQIHRSSGKAHQ